MYRVIILLSFAVAVALTGSLQVGTAPAQTIPPSLLQGGTETAIKERKNGWTPEALEQYRRERDKVAAVTGGFVVTELKAGSKRPVKIEPAAPPKRSSVSRSGAGASPPARRQSAKPFLLAARAPPSSAWCQRPSPFLARTPSCGPTSNWPRPLAEARSFSTASRA